VTATVKALNELLSQVKDEQSYIVVRERTHRNTAESTNARVKWWSIFQLGVLIGMCIFQVWWLKRFFEVSFDYLVTDSEWLIKETTGQASRIKRMYHRQHQQGISKDCPILQPIKFLPPSCHVHWSSLVKEKYCQRQTSVSSHIAFRKHQEKDCNYSHAFRGLQYDSSRQPKSEHTWASCAGFRCICGVQKLTYFGSMKISSCLHSILYTFFAFYSNCLEQPELRADSFKASKPVHIHFEQAPRCPTFHPSNQPSPSKSRSILPWAWGAPLAEHLWQ
jgi:emp24/gp25L/p24 family/GOLD